MDGEKRVLRAWLNRRDIPCPCCQYNLRGLTSGRCPECGSPLRLSITAQAPLGFTVAVCGLGAALGVEAAYEFNYLKLFLAQPEQSQLSYAASDILFHGGVVAVLAATLLLLLRARKWWRKRVDSESDRGTASRNEWARKEVSPKGQRG